MMFYHCIFYQTMARAIKVFLWIVNAGSLRDIPARPAAPAP